MLKRLWGRARPVLVYTLFLFVVVEGLLQVTVRLIMPDPAARRRDSGNMLDTYYYADSVSWGADYWREHEEVEYDYTQIVNYLYTEYHGEHVNIDSLPSGLFRRTWNPNSEADAETLVVLGGSTAWGFGTRDGHSLPSALSRELASRGRNVCVMNAAVNGFTFHQGVMRLLMLLREGFRPRYVVCYDGVNEVLTGLYQGKAGRFMLYKSMARAKEEKRTRPSPGRLLRDVLFSEVMTLRIAHRTWGAIRSGAGPEPATSPSQNGSAQDHDPNRRLARDVVDDYVTTVGLLEHLSQAYGFEYACFWQPSLFTEPHVFPVEEQARRGNRGQDYNNNGRLPLIFPPADSLARGRLADVPHCHWIGDALADRAFPCYIDALHVTEAGNRMIAERIADALEQEFFAAPAH